MPFWQSDERNRGLGLGLYLAKTFIDMSGGSVCHQKRARARRLGVYFTEAGGLTERRGKASPQELSYNSARNARNGAF